LEQVSRLALITPEGLVMSDAPSPQPEEGTTAEPTPLQELCRLAAREAEKASTKGKVDVQSN
jgi:hypothetical protein